MTSLPSVPPEDISQCVVVTREEVRVYSRVLKRDYPDVYYNPRALSRLIYDEVARAESRAPRRAHLPVRAWEAILDRFGHRCAYCGATGKLQRDHRIPFSKGGPDEPSNIVPACWSCNSRKRAQPAEAWPLLVEP